MEALWSSDSCKGVLGGIVPSLLVIMVLQLNWTMKNMEIGGAKPNFFKPNRCGGMLGDCPNREACVSVGYDSNNLKGFCLRLFVKICKIMRLYLTHRQTCLAFIASYGRTGTVAFLPPQM